MKGFQSPNSNRDTIFDVKIIPNKGRSISIEEDFSSPRTQRSTKSLCKKALKFLLESFLDSPFWGDVSGSKKLINPRDSVGSKMSSTDRLSTKSSEIDPSEVIKNMEMGVMKLKELIEEEQLVMNQVVELFEGRGSTNIEDLIEALLYELRVRNSEEKLVQSKIYVDFSQLSNNRLLKNYFRIRFELIELSKNFWRITGKV